MGRRHWRIVLGSQGVLGNWQGPGVPLLAPPGLGILFSAIWLCKVVGHYMLIYSLHKWFHVCCLPLYHKYILHLGNVELYT